MVVSMILAAGIAILIAGFGLIAVSAFRQRRHQRLENAFYRARTLRVTRTGHMRQ